MRPSVDNFLLSFLCAFVILRFALFFCLAKSVERIVENSLFMDSIANDITDFPYVMSVKGEFTDLSHMIGHFT